MSTQRATVVDPPRLQDRPQLGLVAAWFDPMDPRIWSGMFTNVINELSGMGMFAGYRDVTPWPPAARALHRALGVLGRQRGTLPLSPSFRALTHVSNVVARRRAPRDADAWIFPPGTIGRPARGRYLTWAEIAPSQFAAMDPSAASAFGLPDLTDKGLRALVRVNTRLHRHAYARCVDSSWAADAMVEGDGLARHSTHVVGCGRNADVAPPPGRDWSTPRFLFVGNDWERKNGDGVLHAFRQVRAAHPAAQLDVVGGHPPIDIEGVTTHGRVDVHQREGKDRLEHLFGRATCFVMPSRIEPFGIVYVEAAAAGIPSIGTSVGGTATSIGDGGIRVDPADPGALVEAMTCLAEPDRARALGQKALARSEQFTWRKVAERLVRASGLAPEGLELAEFL
jgi:glycosyltransferase involved in cell wall biosynthesis